VRQILKIHDSAELEAQLSLGSDAFVLADRHICVKLGAGAFLVAFHYCDVRNASRKDARVYIYCSPRDLVYVTDNKECRKIAGSLAEDTDNYCQLLEFFAAVCADDLYELEKIEDRITKLEDGMLTKTGRMDDRPAKIIAVRRELLYIKRYYEQLRYITDELAEDEHNALPPDIQARFGMLTRRIDRLLGSVIHLKEYVTQVREAYQAQLDIQQNQIMKVFTVISGVFMPLTLIAGWYGMNLKMPEFTWDFGYVFAIVLSLLVAAFCLILFRIKRWF
jgi:magnesium transporter